jgi:Protein of unknown function (DUF2971)
VVAEERDGREPESNGTRIASALEKESMRVFYMTSTKWAEVILKERRLKLARFGELNDPFELSLIDNRPRATREVVHRITGHFQTTIGVICFGADWKSPVMWAHYADKHFGVALGFEVADALLTKITYSDKKISVPFGEHLPRFGLSEDLLNKIRMTKATDWSYEREFRVESELKIKDPVTGLYYVDFEPQIALREIVIGHRCTWSAASVRPLLRGLAETVRICKARPAFGKFEMIEQRRVKAVNVRSSILKK